MKALLRSWIVRGLALAMAASVFAAAASGAVAQDRVQFRQEELDQMLAPIALYPDPLLSQILMASTYPLEVVEAARWSKANPNLKGQDAVRAVDPMNWDPSVKSLAAFPQVLSMMDSNLEWTESLGEAFLGQQEDVMSSVQGLRRKAEAQGNLLSSDQMRVGREGDYITLAPPAPEVVYVPYYDPRVVYGPWWYPAYPPVFWAPPAYYVGPAYRPGFYWGSGIAISATFFFGHTDWRHRRVTVVNNQVNNVTINRTVVNSRTVVSNRSRVAWQPDPAHRRGAPFHREAARQRFERHAAAAGVTTRSSARSAAPASPSVQQRRAEPRGNAAPEKREARRPERREAPQSRAAPQETHPNVIQGGQRAQPPAQQQQQQNAARAEARRRQAAEPRIENRQVPRPQAQPNAPRPQAESRAPRPVPQRQERQVERERRDAPRAQPQSHSPRPAPAAPRPEARNNGGGAPHHAPAAGAPRPAANHRPAHSNGNQQRTERGPRGHEG